LKNFLTSLIVYTQTFLVQVTHVLGYFFKPNCKLRPSRECLQRLVSKSLRLYEQKANRKQLLEYLERWLIYFRGGLKGMVQIKSIKKIELFIDYNFKISYRYNCRM